ncbi:MAG: hypothetical protein F6K16_33060, partial [Symploca sp. SIO2B6]|nr:hypothetical protein [Symploca sp. SIO2B6]
DSGDADSITAHKPTILSLGANIKYDASVEFEPLGPEPPNNEETERGEIEENVAELDTLDLSTHCFIRNKSLLRSQLMPPPESVAEVILAFHQLPPDDKLTLLTQMNQLLETSELEHSASSVGQTWVKQLNQVRETEQRKTAIWLSRYCAEPANTLEEVRSLLKTKQKIRDHEATMAAAESTADVLPETSSRTLDDSIDHQSENCGEHYSESYQGQERSPSTAYPTSPSRAARRTIRPKNQQRPKSTVLAWAIPAVWCFVVIITLFTKINAASGGTYLAYNICPEDSSSLKACNLAVELAGEMTLEEMHPRRSEGETTPVLSPEAEQDAVEECELMANYYAGFIGDEVFYEKTDVSELPPIISIEGDIALPGIFVTDVIQKNAVATEPDIRVGCVHHFGSKALEFEGMTVWQMASDQIPLNWPEEHYFVDPDLILQSQTSRIHEAFYTAGTDTIFTAIGLFVAVIVSPVFSCSSVGGLYKVASFMGFASGLLSFVPIFSWKARIAISSLILLGATGSVKEFKMDWSQGYQPIALATGIVLGINGFLSLVMYWAIASIVS